MTFTYKTATVGNYHISIHQEKFSPVYHVAMYWYGRTVDDRTYTTIEKANRRYNTLLKRAKAEQ